MTGQKKKIDLSSLDTVAACNKPYKLELLHPVSKEPLGQFVLVYGPESDILQQYRDEQVAERIRKVEEAQRRGTSIKTQTPEEQRAIGIELLVACTAGFEGIEFNGPIDFTHANAKKLYATLPWVKEQVDTAISAIGNFMKT